MCVRLVVFLLLSFPFACRAEKSGLQAWALDVASESDTRSCNDGIVHSSSLVVFVRVHDESLSGHRARETERVEDVFLWSTEFLEGDTLPSLAESASPIPWSKGRRRG